METCGWVLRVARQEHGVDLTAGRHRIVVDVDGLGKGLADRLKELRCAVVPFRGNATPKDPKSYRNSRAEAYAVLGNHLDPSGKYADQPWALPADESCCSQSGRCKTGCGTTKKSKIRLLDSLQVAYEASGLSLREINDRCGISYPYIHRVTNPTDGKPIPSLDVCETLANTLGYDLAEMLVRPREFKRTLRNE